MPMAVFTIFSILFCSYVHRSKVDDNKKVVCTAVIVVIYLITIVLSALFGSNGSEV